MASERQRQSKKIPKARSCTPTRQPGSMPLVESLPAASTVDSSLNTINSLEQLISKTSPTEPLSVKSECPNAWSIALDSKLNALIEQSKAFERERRDLESTRNQTVDIRLSEENARLRKLLSNTRDEYSSLVEFIESEPQPAFREPLTEFPLEIEHLRDQIQFLELELSEARQYQAKVQSDESELRIQIEKLRSQLLESRHEAVESRLQNNELSSSLAKFKGPSESLRAEAMSWEQRKEALLRQLELEIQTEQSCDPRKVLEIEKVIELTTAEIDRRDKEIADLRSLLEQQSYAHDGMAIGVAAVAEMIESDALIIAERVRLRELQQDWEQKQRHVEIEMSMERAKLARERLELQDKVRNFEDLLAENSQPQQCEKKDKGSGRGRWLARLGLRDE